MAVHIHPIPRACGGAIDDQALAHIADQSLAWSNGEPLDIATRHLLKISLPALLAELCQYRAATRSHQITR